MKKFLSLVAIAVYVFVFLIPAEVKAVDGDDGPANKRYPVSVQCQIQQETVSFANCCQQVTFTNYCIKTKCPTGTEPVLPDFPCSY